MSYIFTLDGTGYNVGVESISPVDSHVVVVQCGQATLSYEAYIEIVEDEVEYMDDGTCWGGLTVTFYAREPKRVPT